MTEALDKCKMNNPSLTLCEPQDATALLGWAARSRQHGRHGSCFLTTEAARAKEAPMQPRMLIADADSRLRDIYREFFSETGFCVETAADGLECLSRLRQFAPDVLLVDLEILWGDGEWAIACVQENRRLQLSPLLLVSGTDAPSQISLRTHVPADCCFQKPFRLNDVLGRIRSASEAPGTSGKTCGGGNPLPGTDSLDNLWEFERRVGHPARVLSIWMDDFDERGALGAMRSTRR
jgi:CheY-like chemotaxis protein